MFLGPKQRMLYFLSYHSNFPFVSPMFINFGLTHRCNLRCKICETWEANPKIEEELTLDEIKQVIWEIAKWDKRINISFAGGEPLIRKKDLIEAIKFANSQGLVTHLTTNGTLVTEDVAKGLIESGLNYIQVSLDGATQKTNDFIRYKGSFKGAVRALKNLTKMKEEFDSDIKIAITTVITDKNLDEILDIYEFAKFLGVDRIDYNPYNIDTSYTKGKSYENDEFWVKEKNIPKLKKICEKLIELKRKENRIGTPYLTLKLMPEYFKKKQKFRYGICLAGFSYMYVKPNGNVDVCGKGPSLNVRKHNIKKIWHSVSFAKTRLLIRKCKRPCLMLCFPRIDTKTLLFGREV
ncbi:MAG: radical SAM protein [Candidatus Aenigmarchaeota archaeon]|nr:radical SAM protein [Candidatus Aenigmarchaeota archaeon]